MFQLLVCLVSDVVSAAHTIISSICYTDKTSSHPQILLKLKQWKTVKIVISVLKEFHEVMKGDQCRVLSNCEHIYNKSCIDTWLIDLIFGNKH